MLTFSRPAELPIPQGALLQSSEHYEFVPPPECDAQLQFHVICNGRRIGQARLDRIERPSSGDNRILSLLDARHRATYALTMIRISENHRNRGIGTVLLKEILHYARSHNVHRITGAIDGGAPGERARLREWFRRNGFAIVDENRIEFQRT